MTKDRETQVDERIFSDPEPFDLYPGDDRSPGILLLHGLTGTPAEIRYQGVSLAKGNVGVHCPLLPGHGTTIDELGRTTWRDWLQAVKKKDASLRKIYDPDRFFIGGLSMGALLAIRLFVRHPGNYAGLVVMSVPLVLARLATLAISLYSFLKIPFDIKIPKPGGPDVMDKRVKNLIPSYRRHSMKAAASLLELMQEVRGKDIARIEGNALLLQGRFDITTPPINAEIFRQKAIKAQVTVRMLPRSGHLVTVDHDRDVVSDSILGFIRRKTRKETFGEEGREINHPLRRG